MAELRPFNTSVKDSSSLKLKNFNASKKVTRQLEIDSRVMEDRLRELKITMNREKTERENHGRSNIWASGKSSGTLTSYASDVLRKNHSDKPNKPQEKKKVRKVKVLKDTPLDLPDRPAKPITSSLSGDSPPWRKKFKGPACGQCEDKAVSLTCMECGENYCTTCFARFHLKGALKNHRSIPFQAKDTSRSSLEDRQVSSQVPARRPETPKTNRGSSAQSEAKGRVVIVRTKSPVAPTPTGGALLQGEYNESDSAASFAAALAEWRQVKPEGADGVNEQGRIRPGSQGQLEVHEMGVGESRVEDREDQKLVEITFSKDSLSYADRLLLKRHRRTELKGLSLSPTSPRYQGSSPIGVIPERSMKTAQPWREYEEVKLNGDNDMEEIDEEMREEHQRYVDIFRSSQISQDSLGERLPSQVIITEMTEDMGGENEMQIKYHVEEVSLLPFIGRSSPTTRGSSVQVIQLVSPEDYRNRQAVNERVQEGQNSPHETNISPLQTDNEYLNNIKLNAGVDMTSGKASIRSSLSAGANSSAQHGLKSEGRPASMSGLTKNPSEGLRQVTGLPVMRLKHHYADGLGGFFMAGVSGENDTNSSSNIKERPTTSEIAVSSYKGPSTWRPLSSIAANAPLSFVPTPPKDSKETRPSSGGRRKNAGNQRTVPRVVSPNKTRLTSKLNDGKYSHVSSDLFEHIKNSSPAGDSKGITKRLQMGERETTGTQKLKTATKVEAQVLSRKSGKRNDAFKRSPRSEDPPRSASRIEIEGDDFSAFDGDMGQGNQDEMDNETLEELAWELASQSGRVTADGRLTSQSLLEEDEIQISFSRSKRTAMFASSFDEELGITLDDGLGSGLSTPCEDFTMERLSEEDLKNDFEEIETERDRKAVENLDLYKKEGGDS